MNENEKTINIFTTRLRQLLLQYKEMKAQIKQLQSQIEERDTQMRELKANLTRSQQEYNSLKIAKTIEASAPDVEDAKRQLSKLMRDVNKCITLLSEQ